MIPRARWQQIQSVFEQVIDVPPQERAARLASACGSDSELQALGRIAARLGSSGPRTRC